MKNYDFSKLSFPSLGDLWSFNSASNQFVVSPEPDVNTMTIDVSRHRCLILGTDGLWNMIPPQRAVEVVQHIDRQNKTQPNPDQQPLVRLELHKTQLHNANTLFLFFFLQ